MTVVTLRPDASSNYNATVTGAATIHAALSDNSDASYATTPATDDWFQGNFGTTTIPAGAVVRSVVYRLRCGLNAAATKDHLLYWNAGYQSKTINWTTPTTITLWSLGPDDFGGEIDQSIVDGLYLTVFGSGTGASIQLRSHEAYVDVTYVALPVAAPSAPTGTITTTNRPEVAWANTLDSDGGAQSAFEVKFYTAAEYGGGGFDPDTTTVTTTQSGVTTGSATTWTPSATLADGTYRAYVRVAQTVNGSYHWSDWDYEGFVIDVLLPAIPDLVLYPDADDACTHLIVTGQSGDATTDALELQRSTDGGVTWEPVRLPASESGAAGEGGVVLGDTATLYDFEGGNTQTVYYRVRALHDYSGVYAASDWVTDSDAWTDPGQWWLKSVLTPALNQPVEVHSEPGARLPARQGRFQALGGTHAIVLSDTRASTEGSIVLRADTDQELAAIRALVDDTGTLLLQGAPDNHWVDKYVQVGDLEVQRLVDKSFVEGWLVTLPWIEVESPSGAITVWREVGS